MFERFFDWIEDCFQGDENEKKNNAMIALILNSAYNGTQGT